MEKTLCGADCTACPLQKECRGCTATNGCPFGKQCFVARYIQLGGAGAYRQFRQTLLEEINALSLPGMEPIRELYPLAGRFVNLAYPLPGGTQVKLLDDDQIYLGTQTRCTFGGADTARCIGIVVAPQCLLVSEYGPNGSDPELLLYKKR